MKPRTVLQNKAGAGPSRGDAACRALPSTHATIGPPDLGHFLHPLKKDDLNDYPTYQ